MKKIIAFLLFVVLTVSLVKAQENTPIVDTNKLAEMTFEFTEYDFGVITKGANCSVDFVFKNTGKADLIISNVRASCGCTTPTYTQAPVTRKTTGTVTVKYDSNRIGTFNKSITVTSNAKNSPVIISIRGQVVETATPVVEPEKPNNN